MRRGAAFLLEFRGHNTNFSLTGSEGSGLYLCCLHAPCIRANSKASSCSGLLHFYSFIFQACPVLSYRRIVLAKLWPPRGERSLTENRGCLTRQARRGWLAFINPKDDFAGRALRSRQSSSRYAFIGLPRICAEPFHKDILEVEERQFGDCKKQRGQVRFWLFVSASSIFRICRVSGLFAVSLIFIPKPGEVEKQVQTALSSTKKLRRARPQP